MRYTNPRWRFMNVSFSKTSCLAQLCFSAEELILIHGLGANGSSGMGRSGLSRLSPALLQQVLSGACAKTTDKHASNELSVAESKPGLEPRRRFWLRFFTLSAAAPALSSSP